MQYSTSLARGGVLRADFRTQGIGGVYAIMGALLVLYLLSVLLRPPGSYNPILDGLGVDAFELVLSALCLVGALKWTRHRAIPVVMGLALLSWTMGDTVLTMESFHSANPPTPSLADLFYLGFYPLAYVALVRLVRRDAEQPVPATWLDGAVAGLGAAAFCACFIFKPLLSTVGASPLTVATNLAYPVGDLLLLALVVGGVTALVRRLLLQWVLCAVACVTIAIGDSFNLLQSGGHQFVVGGVLNDVAWPAAILLLSAAMWLAPPPRELGASPHAPGVLIPGAGALCGLVILFLGTQVRLDPIALALAMGTLVTAGVRLALSSRSLRKLTDERQRLSLTDELTGLGNRRRLFDLMNDFLAEQATPGAPWHTLSVLFVDLDHFKEVNDSFGHGAGDELMRQLAPRLREAAGKGPVLVRIGGDELGVLVVDAGPKEVRELAMRVLAKIRPPFMVGQVAVQISARIGIASAPGDASTGAALVRCADLAMYRAKRSHSSIEVYRRDLDEPSNRLRLVEELRNAVSEGAFVLHFQPIRDLASGRAAAVEALLRWPNPRVGTVPPMEFLPLAEEAGLMGQLTAWVFDKALAQSAAWRSSGRELRVSVNVSITNLVDPEFIGQVRAGLQRYRVPPASLMVEITETTMIQDAEACQAGIAGLRSLGVEVAVDDFGAGFTSLAYLAQMPVSELKLDRSFLSGLASDRPRDRDLIGATVELGHSLGMRVVAEGVEEAHTLDLLASLGCDLVQGFFTGRPALAEDLELAPETAGPMTRAQRAIAS